MGIWKPKRLESTKTMGNQKTKEVKEEVIIAQAGNSGGITDTTSQAVTSTRDVLVLIVLGLAIIGIGILCYIRCKKQLERKIRREISKSTDRV